MSTEVILVVFGGLEVDGVAVRTAFVLLFNVGEE